MKKNTISINHMVCLMAFEANNFTPTHAALDLGLHCSNVSYFIKMIEIQFDFPIFKRGYRKGYQAEKGIIGFTDKGQELYFAVKTFLESIMLISKESNSDN